MHRFRTIGLLERISTGLVHLEVTCVSPARGGLTWPLSRVSPGDPTKWLTVCLQPGRTNGLGETSLASSYSVTVTPFDDPDFPELCLWSICFMSPIVHIYFTWDFKNDHRTLLPDATLSSPKQAMVPRLPSSPVCFFSQLPSCRSATRLSQPKERQRPDCAC